MIKNALNANREVFENRLSDHAMQFLDELDKKQDVVDKKLRDIEQKKEKIVKKIAENKKNTGNDPKELREYISNSESVLESIEFVYKNLNMLQELYRSIEKSVLIISEKAKIGVNSSLYDNEIVELAQKMQGAEEFEKACKTDNEQNYLIIDNFFEKQPNINLDLGDPTDFYQLNIDNIQDRPILKICEKRVELPYTKKEIENYMKQYPDDYKTVQDVISKEFMVHISIFNRHPILSRFKEAYYLCRTKEMMTILDSFNYAKKIMFNSNLNPYIIAAVKSKKQLEDYITCLEENRLEDFHHFKIVYEVTPLAV